jgi:glutathionylspermidine synthase
MFRREIKKRWNLPIRFAEYDFNFGADNGVPYWDETAMYEFNLNEVELIEEATEDLHARCLALVNDVVYSNDLLKKLRIPENAWATIRASWRRRDPSLYGRMDFSWNDGTIKLLEYNADTPTSLYEASVFNWQWLEDMNEFTWKDNPRDQFNSLHEKLVNRFKQIYPVRRDIHFAYIESEVEDVTNVLYLADCAMQAGLNPILLDINEIGLLENKFVDHKDNRIETCFKLYPWEWMFAEQFGQNELALGSTNWLEPAWKSIVSNKGFMALLWERNPGHKNLLATYFEEDENNIVASGRYVRKPIFSREGSNIEIYEDGKLEMNGGLYGSEGYIIQEVCSLPDFGGVYPVLGSWIVGSESSGLTIRESNSRITDNMSRFVPHCIVEI